MSIELHSPNPDPNRSPDFPQIEDLVQPFDSMEWQSDEQIFFHGGRRKRSGLRLALWTWVSAGIDGLVLFSMSCFFMIFFSVLMKTSFKSFLNLVFAHRTGFETFAMLFVVVSWSYLIFSRVFMGASIGERTCYLRLGQPIERFQVSYILKVIVRSTVVVLTGIFVLPILSVLFRRDLAGDLSGIKIYSLK